jgi:hypothetical protein
MKKALRMLAVILLIGATVLWGIKGTNTGRTKTSVPVKTLDEVTGIEGINYKKQFVPGVDFLAVAYIAAGLLTGVSFFFPPKSKPTNKQDNQ